MDIKIDGVFWNGRNLKEHLEYMKIFRQELKEKGLLFDMEDKENGKINN